MPEYLTAYCPASCKVKTKHIISADGKEITCRSCGNTRDYKQDRMLRDSAKMIVR